MENVKEIKKQNRFKGDLSRRDFLSLSALGLASLTILPSWKTATGEKIAPSDRVVMGFIGLGQQGCYDFRSFSACPGIQVAACCDVDSMKRERFRRHVAAWQQKTNQNERCDMYEFYEDLLERKDIDAIEVATPDHWHALIAIHACEAGKDVYCQKPLAYTITEGLAVQKAVRANDRILQMGSQQRSSAEFQQAIKLVREKAIGHIDKVYVRVGDPPKPLDLPEMPVPANLNFNQWLGPLNDPKIHYHPDLCPPISLDPEEREKLWGAWRWYQETGNGYPADWGAHMYDIAQAALGMDGSGPIEFIPKGYDGHEHPTMLYANGVVMTDQPFREDKPDDKGIQFIGDKGWLKVARGYIECSDPSLLAKEEKKVGKGQYEISSPHMQNFIDAVRAHVDPIAPVEYGTSTNTLCCLFNIARELNRPVKWNPALLSFEGDKEAAHHRLYYYEYRRPYKLPYLETRNNL
ncbi:MAG: Gfo/Idh/MocA family protein [Phocaeicola sp.]|uniref:Gfo/Idh/MocA family protein n=1 Tax=Phocaeicola TaxID=909656 RepID=UPI00234F5F1A|nr:Gfo/Idh/MocA family oxidoreductase [Phocaeicola oris]MCE2616051.1 Gfo/Idh/MocA family oxidoreductase [Phocaeicola oris]